MANGSFLLNLPLVNHEHRKLAGKLIDAVGPPGKTSSSWKAARAGRRSATATPRPATPDRPGDLQRLAGQLDPLAPGRRWASSSASRGGRSSAPSPRPPPGLAESAWATSAEHVRRRRPTGSTGKLRRPSDYAMTRNCNSQQTTIGQDAPIPTPSLPSAPTPSPNPHEPTTPPPTKSSAEAAGIRGADAHQAAFRPHHRPRSARSSSARTSWCWARWWRCSPAGTC